MQGLSNLLDRLLGGSALGRRLRPRRAERGYELPGGAGDDLDPGDDPDYLDRTGAEAVQAYPTRLSRPHTELGVRIGLWGAVAFGCVGGLLALVGLTTREGDTIIQQGQDADELPAAVARVAERAVEVWLAGDRADESLLQALYVEPPTPPSEVSTASDEVEAATASGLRLEVGPVTTVGGGQWEDGYWLVTVAAEVAECAPADQDGWRAGTDEEGEEGDSAGGTAVPPAELSVVCPDRAGSDDPTGSGAGAAPRPGAAGESESEDRAGAELTAQGTTLFVEVGVVGVLDRRVAALTTPSIVDEPGAVSPEWASTGRRAEPVLAGDPAAVTVEEFLQAWLVGEGDPARHTATGVDVEAMHPAPFVDLSLTEIAYDQEEPGRTGVRAHVTAVTPGGVAMATSYELELAFREDRWEVARYWGAPPLAGRPGDGAEASDPEDEAAPGGPDPGVDQEEDG